MPTRAQKVRLGVFLLLAAVLVGIMVLVFGGTALVTRGDRYYVRVGDSVSGLSKGAQVKIMGVTVGEVTDISLDREHTHVLVELTVPRGTPIYRSATAYIKRAGVTDLRYVDIEQLTVAERVEPGETLPLGSTGLDRLTEQAETITERTVTLLDKANRVLDQALPAVADLSGLVRENRTAVKAAIRDFRAASRAAADGLRGAGSTVSQVDTLIADLHATLRANADELSVTMRNLRAASQSFKELGRELRRSPSSALLSRPPGDRRR